MYGHPVGHKVFKVSLHGWRVKRGQTGLNNTNLIPEASTLMTWLLLKGPVYLLIPSEDIRISTTNFGETQSSDHSRTSSRCLVLPMNPAKTSQKTLRNNSAITSHNSNSGMHLLALKAYMKPELLTSFQTDDIIPKNKNSLRTILQQVAN